LKEFPQYVETVEDPLFPSEEEEEGEVIKGQPPPPEKEEVVPTIVEIAEEEDRELEDLRTKIGNLRIELSRLQNELTNLNETLEREENDLQSAHDSLFGQFLAMFDQNTSAHVRRSGDYGKLLTYIFFGKKLKEMYEAENGKLFFKSLGSPSRTNDALNNELLAIYCIAKGLTKSSKDGKKFVPLKTHIKSAKTAQKMQTTKFVKFYKDFKETSEGITMNYYQTKDLQEMRYFPSYRSLRRIQKKRKKREGKHETLSGFLKEQRLKYKDKKLTLYNRSFQTLRDLRDLKIKFSNHIKKHIQEYMFAPSVLHLV
jgi:hypothetical protein